MAIRERPAGSSPAEAVERMLELELEHYVVTEELIRPMMLEFGRLIESTPALKAGMRDLMARLIDVAAEELGREAGVDPLEPLIDALQSGDSIIIFPEGTRGNAEEPQPFKSGLYSLAMRFPNVVLVPAWIDNIQRVMPKGEVVPVPILCSVTFGAPVQLEPGEDRRHFLDRARAAVVALRDV